MLSLIGVVLVNISKATIHSGLGINVGNRMFPLNDHQYTTLRNKLSEVKLVITDEISMVSSEFLGQVVTFLDFQVAYIMMGCQFWYVMISSSYPSQRVTCL